MRAAAQKLRRRDDENILLEFDDYLARNGGPHVLYFGDSHLNHLKDFINKGGLHRSVANAFKNSEFVAVGGTTWGRIEENVKGSGLTKYQKHRGDQWTPYINGSHKAQYVVISLGGNDVDSYAGMPYGMGDFSKRKGQWKQHHCDLLCQFNTIKGNIDKVMKFLSDNLDNPQFYYIKIIPRCWWSDSGRRLAHWVDYYILCTLRKRYHVMEIWTREIFASHYKFYEQPMFGMLKTDIVHFNHYGNIALIRSIMRPLLNKWRLQRENAAFLEKVGIKLPC